MLLNSVGLGSSATAPAVTNGLLTPAEVVTATTQGSTRLGLDTSVGSVPEPVSLALLGTCLADTGLIRRRDAA